MQPLRYSINVTLDGRCEHTAIEANEEMHRHGVEVIAGADALIFGRVIYGMMESAWREPAETGVRPEWMPDWMMSFARTIHAAKKYVVSNTLTHADWNSEIVRGDQLQAKVRELKRQTGRGLYTGGVTLPLALAEMGLIDEYTFVVHPRLAGHGRAPLAGLSKPLDLKLIDRREFASGAAAMRYEVKR